MVHYAQFHYKINSSDISWTNDYDLGISMCGYYTGNNIDFTICYYQLHMEPTISIYLLLQELRV